MQYVRLTSSQHPYWRKKSYQDRHDKVVTPGETRPIGNSARQGRDDGLPRREQYLTNPDGTPVTSDRAKEIRSYAYGYFRDFVNAHGIEALPRKWKNASRQFKDNFASYMLSLAPETGFCENGWQNDEIGKGAFCAWRGNFITNLDVRTVTDPGLIDEINNAKKKRDTKMGKRRAKKAAEKAATLGTSHTMLMATFSRC